MRKYTVGKRRLLLLEQFDTILSIPRLYACTVATDYYRVMNDVERRLELIPTPEQPHTEPGQLVVLVDALSLWALNDSPTGVGS